MASKKARSQRGYMIAPFVALTVVLIVASMWFYFSDSDRIFAKGVSYEGSIKQDMVRVEKLRLQIEAAAAQTLYSQNSAADKAAMQNYIKSAVLSSTGADVSVLLSNATYKRTNLSITVNSAFLETSNEVNLTGFKFNSTMYHPFYRYTEMYSSFSAASYCSSCTSAEFDDPEKMHWKITAQPGAPCVLTVKIYDKENVLTAEKPFTFQKNC
ncbi:MAG: hypothetical protein V1911_02195 [Candidatus Micrarchaeota archaeon]